MVLGDIIKKLETAAPEDFAQDWDNVGLLVSPLTEKIVDGKIKVLLCNDIVDTVRFSPHCYVLGCG